MKLAKHLPLGVGLVTFGVYLLTLRSDIGLGDAAELSLQAQALGVTHPPGYPVHTFLGKLFTLAISDGAVATALLSAVCTSMAAGFLCAIVLGLTSHWLAGAIAPLVFALTPAVWGAAVTTEVYNVNICILAIALWAVLRWRGALNGFPRDSSSQPTGDGTTYGSRFDKRSTLLLCITGVLLGISFGSGLANVLLLPGFAVLMAYHIDDARGEMLGNKPSPCEDSHPGTSGKPATRLGQWRHPAFAILITAVTACMVLSWSYVRSSTHPPFGSEWLPNTPGDFVRFLSGAQYTALSSRPGTFYLTRPLEHALYWCESLLWLGVILGLWGAWLQWRRQRVLCVSLALMFIMNLGYFTFHPWLDYREMVTPSYFVFAVWIGYGICGADTAWAKGRARITVVAVALGMVLGLLTLGMPGHLKDKQGRPVREFVETSLEWFPPGAVVVARWYEFTPLLYYQQTRGLRPDVTIVERSDRPRHYKWGMVDDWRRYVLAVARRRTVLVDGVEETLLGSCEFLPLQGGWYRLTIARQRPLKHE